MYFCKGRENSSGNWSGSFFGPSCLDCILLLFSSELSNLGKVKFPGLFATNIIGEGTGPWHWGHLRPSQKISQHVSSYNSRVPVPGKDMRLWGVFSILMVLRTWSQVDQLTTGNFYQREVHFVWVRRYIKHPVRFGAYSRNWFSCKSFLRIGHGKIDIYMDLTILFFPLSKASKKFF